MSARPAGRRLHGVERGGVPDLASVWGTAGSQVLHPPGGGCGMTTLLSPRPAILDERISMKYGAGGRAMRALIEGVFLAGAAEAPENASEDITIGLSAMDDGAA